MPALKNGHPALRFLAIPIILGLLALLVWLPGCSGGDLSFPTEYQAVFLDNGQVYFGRLEDRGSSYLTLKDVFYVQTVTDREKKETRNLLVKRGNEGHGPDFMKINSRHVLFIEPVAPDSRVSRLIIEAKTRPVAPPAAAAPPARTPPAAAPKTDKKGPAGK